MRVRALLVAGLFARTVAAAEPVPTGTLDVSTSDLRGAVRVDGSEVGAGSFHGDLPPGLHAVTVSRPGFKPYERSVVIEAGKTTSLTVSLERTPAPPPPPAAEVFSGFYGGFFLGPSLEPGGAGSTWEQSCSLIGATSCSAPMPAGLAVAAHAGYTWDPVGIELFGAFAMDYTSPSATFNGQVSPGSNPVLTGPARNESFRVLRVGGMGAVRARATINGKAWRGSLAAGVGFGAHVMAMDRTATTTDGTNLSDVFAPPTVSYVSPALSFEVGFGWRVSRLITLDLGVSLWIETASGVTTQADDQHYFLPSGLPLRTPSYRLAGGAQTFVWPFVGMTFGP